MAYTVTFWGTRGSIPTPGAHTARYGGNTPCVAVEGSGGGKGGRGGQLVILDAGTGIRALGRELVGRDSGAVRGDRLPPAAGGPSMAYVTDNELGPGGHYETAASWRKDFVAFLGGVELLIHDAMYTPEELEEHRGWGHATFEEAVALAGDAGVKRLVLFHHEPEHGDEAIDALLAAARRQARAKGLPAEVVAAQEGMTLTL